MMILAINCSSESFITLFKIIATFARLIYIAIPIMLIVFGMIDFIKVVMSEKAENGAAMKTFLKRLISTILVFMVVPIVMLVIGIINDGVNSSSTVSGCTDTIIKGLLNPSSVKAEESEEVVETSEAVAFKSKCETANGSYSKVSLALYQNEYTTVIDSYSDGTYIYLCTSR